MYINKMKNEIAILLALIMIINLLPIQHLTVHAFDLEQYKVDAVTIFKIYDSNRNIEMRRLLIRGLNLKDAEVGMETSTGYNLLTKRTINTETVLQFDLDNDQLGRYVSIGNCNISIDEEEMPTLTGVNRRVKAGSEALVIAGTKLTNINATGKNIKAGYEHDSAYTSITSITDNDNKLTVENPKGTLGLQNIIFEKEEEISKVYFNDKYPEAKVKVNIIYTYKDQFRLYKDIEIDDNKLIMYPNRGQKGDRVYFETPAGMLDSYDVFILKHTDGTDPYTERNNGKNKTFQQNINGKDILTVEVPDIEVGEYFVVFTNAVTLGKDPMKEVTMEKILKEKFTVISSNIKSRVISINPRSGPDTGSKATISAQFAGTLNIPEFAPGSDEKTYSFSDGDKELVVNYVYGTYKNSTDKTYSATRKIKIIIGDNAQFIKKPDGKPDSTFTKDLDTINIMTPLITDADINPVKDVIMETETQIIELPSTVVQTVRERAVLKNGYTYIVSKVQPTIDSIIPEKIQVVPNGNIYKTPDIAFDGDEGRLIAIDGKNFMIHKYTDAEGNDVIRYPVVEIGPNIVLDKNENPQEPPINIKVLNSAGAELDGSTGNELGTKILVYIPPNSSVGNNIGKTYLKVTNPIRNSDKMGLYDLKADFVEFVYTDENKNPIISGVKPDTVAIDGGVEVKITGSNFLDGVRLFLGGEEIKTIKRGEDGKEITFTAPKGREGTTQLMVMNPEGGAATWLFTYVKTYTNPKINYFAPKSGNTGTLVIVKGDNFLQPDPAATPDMVYRLLGTRILLGNMDINDYMLEPTTKRIKFETFVAKSGNPVLQIIEEKSLKYIKTAEYYNSVIFQVDGSDPAKYYALNIDGAGRITLTDGINNNYLLEIDGDKIKANKAGGSIYDLTANNSSIVIKDSNGNEILKLIMKTPYKTAIDEDGQKIIGNRVKVVDKNTIYFTVPALEADGYYDVTVLNPDTKRDDKKGTEGFLYYKLPQSKPEISEIEPNEGTTDGGYSIDIIGKEFDDIGVDKVKVFINGVQADPADVTVSPDGKKITLLKVPKYPGDLYAEKGTNRYTVPVVVVNPDGGSAAKDDGFTYLVPTSHPNILKIIPTKGTAAGGDIVEITGSDFRFFEPYEDANRNQIRDPEEWFNDVNGNNYWDSDANFEYEETMPDGTKVTKDWRDPKTIVHPRYDKYYASPILPKVFFGDKQAKIVEFGRGYLKVISPEANAGKADVYIVNNDSGISNKQGFTYESSNPKITRIFPKSGKMQGGDIIELLGSGFARSSMDIYNGEADDGGISKYEAEQMPQVRFGSITNRYIDRTEENSGRIDNRKATVRFPLMNLTVEYDATGSDTMLKLSKVVGDKLYTAQIKGYNDSVKYIPLSLLKNNEGKAYEATGLVRVEVEDRRLLIDTGYSEEVRYMGDWQLFVKVPTYHTIGKNIPVELINPDKGMAATTFEYMNPYDYPVISSIEPINKVLKNSGLIEDYDGNPVPGDEEYYTYVSLTGGVLLTIKGNNFKRTTKVYLDDKELQILDRSPNGDKLIVVIPPADASQEGIKKPITVDNGDGGVTGTREFSDYYKMNAPYFVVYQKGLSGPKIESVIPDKTSSRGQNIITIIGSDFRPGGKVFIGGLAAEVVEIQGTERIRVKVPLGLISGKASVMVQNSDYGADEKKDALTIISSPEIQDILDEQGISLSPRVLDMTGGENIIIKGIEFQEGAQVILGGTIKTKNDLEEGETGIQGINIKDEEVYIIGGSAATVSKVEDGILIHLTTPAMPEGDISLIVINKDGGVSEPENIKTTRPIPGKPTDAKAYAVDGDTIKLVWKGTADMYQIEGSFGEKQNSKELNTYNYIMTVEPERMDDGNLVYYVRGLMIETYYKFRIKAVNDFGVSLDYAYSNVVKTLNSISSEHKYNDEYINPSSRKDYTEILKDKFIYNIGEKSIKEGSNFYKIELRNKGIIQGIPRQIKIPVTVIQEYNKTYNIWDKDAAIKFQNNVLNTAEIAALKGKDRNDAAAVLEIYNPSGQRNDDIIMQAGRRRKVIQIIGIDFKLQKQDKTIELPNFQGSLEITILFDTKYAKEENLELYYYNVSSNKLEKIPNQRDGSRGLKAQITNPGQYVITGTGR